MTFFRSGCFLSRALMNHQSISAAVMITMIAPLGPRKKDGTEETRPISYSSMSAALSPPAPPLFRTFAIRLAFLFGAIAQSLAALMASRARASCCGSGGLYEEGSSS